jgi:hypothetical protein
MLVFLQALINNKDGKLAINGSNNANNNFNITSFILLP